MEIVNVHRAKTELSKLLERVAHGEEIVIGKAGKPVAWLKPYQSKSGIRKPGIWKGKVSIAPDFDELPADVMKAFEGDEP
jgi:prevent-host-death family protein